MHAIANTTLAMGILMATLSTISVFSSSQETWTTYMERLQQYLAANNIEDADQQRAVLLSVHGQATYRLIQSLVSPKKPTEPKFAELVEVLQNLWKFCRNAMILNHLSLCSVTYSTHAIALRERLSHHT